MGNRKSKLKDLDGYVRETIAANPNMLVPHYLIHSYLYYVLDTAVISDHLYEEICKDLSVRWDAVTHNHKHIIDKASLSAGTGYYLKEDSYPSIVKGAARSMVLLLNKG
jgi:hypothetical protein